MVGRPLLAAPSTTVSMDNNARQVGVHGGRLFAQKTGKKVGEKGEEDL